MDKSRRKRMKTAMVNSAEKEQYLIEASAFAAAVAEELKDPDAEKIYCPAFKVKPCACVQRFISGGDVSSFPTEGAVRRATELLRLHKEAKRLKSKISTDRHDKGDKRVLRMIRAEGFEKFILSKRLVVRQEMGICERACQRLLFYSNNFLHKDLKTGPEKGPRIKRFGTRKLSRQTLKPLSEISRELCCPEKCVRQAITQFRLLESWRKNAQASQQGVRKVIQEILSSKQSNCHKFITLVTGCSFSTIYKVKEQLKRKGKISIEKEPTWSGSDPESNKSNNNFLEILDAASLSNIDMTISDTPSHHEISLLNGSHDIELQPTEIQYQLDQPILSQFIQTISSPSHQVVSVPASSSAESPPQSHTLTVLGPASTHSPNYSHLQFVDNSQLLIGVSDQIQAQTISLMASPSSLDSLYGNVVYFPESTTILMPPSM